MCDPSSQGPERRPAPHTAARGGRRRGGFQTRPRPHHQNSPRRCRPPPVSPAAHHRPIPTVEPARRPGPHAAARGGRRRGGFQTRPCPHHQNSPRRSRPRPFHRPPTTGQSPPSNPQGGPAPHTASQGGRCRGGFQTRPCPHHQNSPRRSRPRPFHRPPTTGQSPPSNPQGGPAPTPRPREADVGAGFKPARAHQTDGPGFPDLPPTEPGCPGCIDGFGRGRPHRG